MVGTPTYTGAAVAAGTFTGGTASGIGMEAGIILTSGNAADASGPNSSDSTTTSNGSPGDADLDSLIPGFSTHDAAVLEFQFQTSGGDLFFNFVFASEEYNEYTNSGFNDTFGFFLDGTNIALIPGTTTPVAINTVNGGNPLGTNPSNPQYFKNNDLSDGGALYDTEYDGFTTVFTAQALGLSAGTHTIKLAIADAGDTALDSAVFIQAGSFSDTPSTEGFIFSGFFAPIDNDGVVNQAKAGQAIPVKWRLTDADGTPIDDPSSFVSITSVGTNCAAPEGSDAVEEYTGTSGLQYLGDGYWQYNWKTPKSYAGQCRIMRLNLADEEGSLSSRTAHFQFK